MYQGIQGALSGICAEIVNYFVADGTWGYIPLTHSV